MGNQGGNMGNQGGNAGNQGENTGNQGGNAGNNSGNVGNQGGNAGNQGGNTGFYKAFSREDIPRYILKIKETLIPRNTSQQLLPRVVISSFFINF